MTCDTIFNERCNNPIFNTSYPLKPSDWERYAVTNLKDYDFSCLEFDNNNLAIYIHIPFCNKLCSFCEYTKMVTPSHDLQMKYLDTIKKDIQNFFRYRSKNSIFFKGLDVGGGTPTALDDEAFAYLLRIIKEMEYKYANASGFHGASIEATFETLT